MSTCVFRDKAVGQTHTERGLGTLAGRVSRPAAALLGRFGDSASRSTGSDGQAEKVRVAPGKPELVPESGP